MLTDPRLSTRYILSKPAGTHRRPATCEEVDCRYHREGWRMRVMPGTELGQRQEHLIRQSGRRFTAVNEPGARVYTFEAGQTCFGVHTVPLDRPALYLARQGTGPVVRHTRPELWVEDFSEHLDKIKEQ